VESSQWAGPCNPLLLAIDAACRGPDSINSTFGVMTTSTLQGQNLPDDGQIVVLTLDEGGRAVLP
jgi:hypothetical protein